jgi:hypothetical protein
LPLTLTATASVCSLPITELLIRLRLCIYFTPDLIHVLLLKFNDHNSEEMRTSLNGIQ